MNLSNAMRSLRRNPGTTAILYKGGLIKTASEHTPRYDDWIRDRDLVGIYTDQAEISQIREDIEAMASEQSLALNCR